MKRLTLFLLILSLCLTAMTSCFGGKTMNDPIALANALEEGDRHERYKVGIGFSAADMERNCKALGVEDDAIYCMMAFQGPPRDGAKGNNMGNLAYCKNTATAKAVEKAAIDRYGHVSGDENPLIYDFIIERSGKLVFWGCADSWEKIKES